MARIIAYGMEFKSKKNLCEYFGIDYAKFNKTLARGISPEASINIVRSSSSKESKWSKMSYKEVAEVNCVPLPLFIAYLNEGNNISTSLYLAKNSNISLESLIANSPVKGSLFIRSLMSGMTFSDISGSEGFFFRVEGRIYRKLIDVCRAYNKDHQKVYSMLIDGYHIAEALGISTN